MAADRSREDRPDASGSRDGAPDVRRPGSGATRLTPEEIISRGFASAFRGVSETEVRNFLRRVADELAAARDHERSLAERVTDLEQQLRTPPPLSEQQLLEGLGEETTRVLRSAQEAAADIRKRADERSATTLQDAQDAARQLREAADAHATERTDSADAAASERERESIEHADAARVVAERSAAETAERATADADAEIERARETGRAMVEEARAVRERVLADLARRRALMQAQLDELRGGREQLLDAYRVVKQTLADAITALSGVQAKAHAEGGIEIEPVPEDGIDFSLDADDGSDAAASAPDQASSEPAPVERVGPGDNPASATAVDALFARLKEERPEPQPQPEPEPEARPAPRAEPESAPEPEPEPEPVPEPAANEDPPVIDAPSEAPVSASVDLVSEEPVPARAAASAAAVEIPPELAARDEAVAKVRSALGRRAKRALQDEQNELLDALRKAKGRPTAEAALPSVEGQGEAWADVLAPAVDEVYRAATRAISADGVPEGVPREFLVVLATDLGAPLRERLISAFETDAADGDGEDGDVAQRVGSRYREWRTQALDGALADALVAAWAQGTIDAAADDARLRWVTPAGGCCPDCDDDALETTPRGQAFPTGQLAPPAHPGCRCVIVVEAMTVSTATAGSGSQ